MRLISAWSPPWPARDDGAVAGRAITSTWASASFLLSSSMSSTRRAVWSSRIWVSGRRAACTVTWGGRTRANSGSWVELDDGISNPIRRGAASFDILSSSIDLEPGRSPATKAANASGVPVAGRVPISIRRARMSGASKPCTTARLSAITLSRGRLAGPIRAYQLDTSKPLTPASSSVGTSGSSGQRCSSVTPSARNFPERTCGMTLGRLLNITWIWLAIRSGIARPAPL